MTNGDKTYIYLGKARKLIEGQAKAGNIFVRHAAKQQRTNGVQ